MKTLHLLLLCALLFSACDRRRQELKKVLKEWKNKEIVFPELAAKYMGRDTLLPDLLDHEFKILQYVDTAGCTDCRLRLYDWKRYMKTLDSLSADVALVFVVFSSNYEEFEVMQQAIRFTFPVMYDYQGRLNEENRFPTSPYPLHTFLLDRDNKVLAIGDPIGNPSIRPIFEKIIKGEAQ